MPRADLLYLTFNSEADVPHLPALVQAAGEDLDVIAVDNASTDGSVQALEALDLQVDVCERNLGFTAGINRALQQVTSEWAIIANPDVRVVEQDWLPRLLDVPECCGIVGARLTGGLSTMGGGKLAPRPLPIMRSSWRDVKGGQVKCTDLLGWSRVTQEVGGPGDFLAEREVAWVAFALAALRMNMVEQIGALDDRYWHFVSDQEYGLRAWASGWSVWFKPITFLHPGNTALQTAPDEAHSFVRDDIRRWCVGEREYLESCERLVP